MLASCPGCCSLLKSIAGALRCFPGFRWKQGSRFMAEAQLYRRSFSISFTRTRQSSGGGIMNVFDQNTKLHQKNVAAGLPDHHVYDYLRDEVRFFFLIFRYIFNETLQ